jgi:hypothetical protein
MMNKLSCYLFFLLCLSFENSIFSQPDDTLTYVFFAHTYQGGEPDGKKVDFRLEAMDMSQFDRIWLGGDIGAEADLNYVNFSYLDSIFSIRKPGNHWALGNHDTRNENIEWFEEYTGKPRYYAYSENNITTIVMDGNITPLDCESLNEQFNIIKNVCDTISSGYLIFLIHQGLVTGVPGVAGSITYAHTEMKNWLPNCYSDTVTYANTIYPMLKDVESRGVNVLHITGDTGGYHKKYYGVSDDGVEYFAAGLGNGYKILAGIPIDFPDIALVFKHVLSTNVLTWEFVEVNDL